MARYSVQAKVVSGANLDLINLTGSTAVRPKLYDVTVGSSDAPADNAQQLEILRTTTAGTGTGLTEEPLDPLTVAATATAQKGTFSPVPTEGNVLFLLALNQRATYRWVAAPGSEFIAAAAANNGLMLTARGSATHNIDATFLWEE